MSNTAFLHLQVFGVFGLSVIALIFGFGPAWTTVEADTGQLLIIMNDWKREKARDGHEAAPAQIEDLADG